MEESYNGTEIIVSRQTNGRPESIRLTQHRTGDLAYYRFQDDRRVARSSIVRQYILSALGWSANAPQRDLDGRETVAKTESNNGEAEDSESALCTSADEERTAAPRQEKPRRRLRIKAAKALEELQNMDASQLFYEDVHGDGFMHQEEDQTRSDDEYFHDQPQNSND